MEIKHFKYFVDVARLKSFSKAAQVNFVSQSTISKVIRDLEEELGTPLFLRSSKFVELTDAGERLFLKAAKIVEMFQGVTRYFQDEMTSEKGLLRIGLPPITGATVFGQLLGRFKRRHAGIDIQLFEYGSKNVEAAVQEGSIDVGIVCSKPQEGQYGTVLFPKDPLKVVLHPSHPLSELRQIDFRDLENENFVLFRKDFSDTAGKFFVFTYKMNRPAQIMAFRVPQKIEDQQIFFSRTEPCAAPDHLAVQ